MEKDIPHFPVNAHIPKFAMCGGGFTAQVVIGNKLLRSIVVDLVVPCERMIAGKVGPHLVKRIDVVALEMTDFDRFQHVTPGLEFVLAAKFYEYWQDWKVRGS